MNNKTNTKTEVVKNTTTEKVAKKSVYADLIAKIGELKITELNQFIKELQEHFQIDPAISVASSQSGKTEEKTKDTGLVDLVLTETGQGKVAVIKIIAKVTGKGLLDAKKMLDNLPLTVLSQKPEAEAEKLQKELQDAGAVVAIK